MRDVAPGLADRVVLPETARNPAPGNAGPADPGLLLEFADGAAQQIEQVVKRALLDRQTAVHIEFAERKLRIEEQSALAGAVMYPHRHIRPVAAPVSDRLACPGSVHKCQLAGGHALVQQSSQQHRPISPLAGN